MHKYRDSGNSDNPSVLIIAYRRPENVAKILALCDKAQVAEIYLSIDAPKIDSVAGWEDHRNLLSTIEDFEKSSGRLVHKRIARENQGCAVNLLLGCDWAFKSAESLIVIEDDCIPTKAFIDFYKSHISYLSHHDDVWLLCGTQFAPLNVTDGHAVISKYALTWGWGTTRLKWVEISEIFRQTFSKSQIRTLLTFAGPEKSFWAAGSRRAKLGFTDVWDTVLLNSMQERGKFAILPPVNLVLNLGADSVSTHVKSNSHWTNREPDENYHVSENPPKRCREVDEWLKQKFYSISLRHILTTKLTFIFDLLWPRKRRKFDDTLRNRLNNE
jgi:hypothetical protein